MICSSHGPSVSWQGCSRRGCSDGDWGEKAIGRVGKPGSRQDGQCATERVRDRILQIGARKLGISGSSAQIPDGDGGLGSRAVDRVLQRQTQKGGRAKMLADGARVDEWLGRRREGLLQGLVQDRIGWLGLDGGGFWAVVTIESKGGVGS
ncbi:hypothetical protein LIA77_04430 [Sarocladium implicatum]|nr:hypothetical protein LIA77_04430 [Sarocladium implicatum]